MTIWTQALFDGAAPRYRAIVEALEASIRDGRLTAGERLPPQRELARTLDVSLGTVTRAYAEARERGLVEATVGRGTFVRPAAVDRLDGLGARVDPDLIDLSLLVAPVLEDEDWPERLREVAGRVAERADLRDLLGYQRHEGIDRHRQAGASWIGRTGLDTSAGTVLVTGSAQHAVVTALSVLTRPGDVVLAEEMTTPGLKDAASWLHLRLHGVRADEHGLLPDALEHACRTGVGRVLYTMPTHQNPTTRTMPEGRREEIARIARSHGVAVVEDGVHALMAEDAPPPLSAHLPDHGYFVTSHSKTSSPSLRVGYLRAPPAAHDDLTFAMRASLWMASPLLAEVASAWIQDGTADALLEAKRAEARERQALAGELLEGVGYEAGRASHHLWLPLPDRWQTGSFVSEARSRGVAVTSPGTFTAGQVTAPRAVRVCLGSARDRSALRKGLGVVRDLL